MKLRLASLFTAFVLWSAPLLAWWEPQIQYTVAPLQVSARVFNHSPRMAYCQGYIFGHTQMGQYFYTWLASYIPAYGNQIGFVYAYQPYYFVGVTSNILCQ